jgi:hypothetical protein
MLLHTIFTWLAGMFEKKKIPKEVSIIFFYAQRIQNTPTKQEWNPTPPLNDSPFLTLDLPYLFAIISSRNSSSSQQVASTLEIIHFEYTLLPLQVKEQNKPQTAILLRSFVLTISSLP